ncbi:MAG TPA: AMP-binding protein [Candidatus Competibacteraceae bacterium]|nr:AMP-binding protein [Candidatus Competibacteraceae bacterium]
MPTMPAETACSAAEATAQLLLRTTTELLKESGYAAPSPTLDSALDRDLGLDSLGRAELVVRLERACDVRLGDEALLAETPRDLLRLVLAAQGMARSAPLPMPAPLAPSAAHGTPTHATTLLEVLEWRVQAEPNRTYLHLYETPERAEELSYAALQQGARAVAGGLLGRGLEPGQAVAIMLPTGRGYFFSFFGILQAGGVPVPIYPPLRPAQLEEHLRRHVGILRNARTRMLITVTEARPFARLLRAHVDGLRHVVTVEDLTNAADHAACPSLRGQDIAFLQYTSGSTGDPKGVILTHANLLANLRAMGERLEASPRDVFVSWLPLYHDMGLIGAALGSLYYGLPLVLMSPLSFLARPARWLWAIHQHRGTLSAAPNFAYELCLRIADADLHGLDLSSWRLAVNGAEPVSPLTMQRFAQRFARYGLQPAALTPVYGLAECALGLTLPRPGQGLHIDRIHREVFMRSGLALPVAADDPNVLEVVGCGQPLRGHQLRIVDEAGRELPERQEGRLEFQGPSATSGYLHNPEATRKLFHGAWLDSGDRAYISGGELYPTGRVKDVIIHGGRNIHPQELEQAIGEIEGVRKGCVAAFGSADPRSGTERLVVVAETRETQPEKLAAMERHIREVTVSLVALPPDEVVWVPPHSVLKTSSGKIRRAAIRELYQHGALGRGGRAVWWQLARLAVGSVWPQLRQLLWRSRDSLFAGYAWLTFGALITLAWVLVAVLPGTERRWAVCRWIARGLRRCTGTKLDIQGLDQLPPGPCVLVANHASYLDIFVLTAAIPRGFSYTAKRELAERWPVRLLLERLGTVFVERFDPRQCADEAQKLVQIACSGRSLAFFPEGTFARMPGLLPFHMGAFVVAARTGLAVVPVTIRGTRSMLRDGSWFPRRGRLRVIIEAPLQPAGDDWQAAVKLRDAARAAILRHCGEPDLGDEAAFG